MADDLRAVFANRLRTARLDANITQDLLAERAGLAREMIARYENQKSFPAIDTLMKIAGSLNVTTDYLLGLSDNPQGYEQPITIAAHPTEGMPPISPERLDEIIAEAVAKIRSEALKKANKREE